MDAAGRGKLGDQREDRDPALLQIVDRLDDERMHGRDDADGVAFARRVA